MKKFTIISLLLLYLVSTTELYQVFKLPILLEHYAEHKSKNQELSFWGFLGMHYNQEFDHDNQDHKLPFKNHDSNFAISIIAFIPQILTISFSKNIEFKLIEPIIYKKRHFSSSALNTIWQPPRA